MNNLTNREPSKKITIIGGYGKMGQWLIPLFLKNNYQIQVHSRTPQPEVQPFISDLKDSVIDASWIVLATPLSITQELLGKILPLLEDAPNPPIICDIASVKAPIIPLIKKYSARNIPYVSFHPLCGPDTPHQGAKILLCTNNFPEEEQLLTGVLEILGSKIIQVPLIEHDLLMNSVISLPHFINHLFAFTLREKNNKPEQLKNILGTTFSAQANIASVVAHEDPDLYYHILADNPYTPQLISKLIRDLEVLRTLTVTDAQKAKNLWKELMQANREYFDKLGIDPKQARSFFLTASGESESYKKKRNS